MKTKIPGLTWKHNFFDFTRLATIALLVVIAMAWGTAAVDAQQFWRTDGVSAAWTGNNWGASAAGPFATAYAANSDAQFTANAAVTFATAAIGNVTVAANQTVTVTAGGTATFGALGSGGLVRTFDIGSGATLTWQSQTITATSTAGLIKNGSGTLDLGSLTWTTSMNGGFTLNAGTLIVVGNKSQGNGVLNLNGGTLQTSGSHDYTPASIVIGGDFALAGTGNQDWDAATTIALGAATRTIANNTTSGSRQFRGQISGGSGAGLNFTGSGGAQIYLGNAGNTFDGPFAITGGEVVVNDNGALGATTAITVDGGRLTMASMNTAGTASALTAATIASGKNIFMGASANTSISIQGGTGVTTYNGVIADKPGSTGAWAKQGAGKLVLGGASTFSGNVSINNGTVQLTTGDNRLPTGATVYLGQAASANLGTLDLNGRNQTIAGLNSTAGINATVAKNMVTNSSATPATLTLAGSGAYSYGNGTTNNSGVIAGPVNLVVNGSGTNTLGDTNTYTGTTSISAGTLALSGTGAIAGTPQVAIAAGATFDVSAAGFTFAGAGPVQTLAGGSSSGTANLNATGKTVTLAAGANALFHIVVGGSPTVGKISVAGALTLNNNVVTVSIDSGTLPPGTNQLLACTGTLTGSANSTPVITGAGSLGGSASIRTTVGVGGHVDLVVSQSTASVSVTASENPSGFNDPVSFTATLPSDATGNVVFASTNGPISTNVITAGVAVSGVLSTLPRGTNVITAVYGGDVNYLGNVGTLNQIVTRAC